METIQEGGCKKGAAVEVGKYTGFYATCSNVEVKETEKYFYKICSFGEMRLWKKSNRISVCKNKTNHL